MKFSRKILLLFAYVLLITGCNKNDANVKIATNESSIDTVLNNQITSEEQKESNSEISTEYTTNLQSNEFATTENQETTVDFDLTTMSSDMVYATIYQMMMYPDQYTGKTFRMDGNFYAIYYEPTHKYYYYCIIQDATACCSQGMEFVWEDGSHIYPDEYPPENAYVIIEGVFETYKEDGDTNLYCRLNNATLLNTEISP